MVYAMKVKVVGISNVSYTSKKTNQLVEGKTLHVVSKATREGDLGELTDTIFISVKANCFSQVAKLKLGSSINVLYNRYGSVEDIQICE